MRYHDREWGVPLHEDNRLYEFLLLDGFQAGLNWSIIIHKRENFQAAFDNFNPELIASYDDNKIASLLQDRGIIRNRLKIIAAITNARCFLDVKDKYGSFDEYIWRFVDGRTIHNNWKTLQQIPARTQQSDAMSLDLKKKGFQFVGSTICYAFMQAAGMVNDHQINCFRYKELYQEGE
ncbi:MAG: DNA-3-methyladenine glycosylase I [Candidatus Cloacimonetes bacterium]|nr:DNA-3-methyladenine glycosylase I [Candidatus Cloacimonadota bacterium]